MKLPCANLIKSAGWWVELKVKSCKLRVEVRVAGSWWLRPGHMQENVKAQKNLLQSVDFCYQIW